MINPYLILAIGIAVPGTLKFIGRTTYNGVQAYKQWYRGCRAREAVGMFFLVRGTKMVRTKCRTMQADDRIWFSPDVEGFRMTPRDVERENAEFASAQMGRV